MNGNPNNVEEIKKVQGIKTEQEVKDTEDIIADKIEEVLVNTKDHASQYAQDDMYKYKNEAILSYIPLVCIYFIVNGKVKLSNYLHFHVNQGMLCTIFWAVIFIIQKLLKIIFRVNNFYQDYIPGWVLATSWVFFCLAVALSTFGIINTYNGKSKELPIIGKQRIIK